MKLDIRKQTFAVYVLVLALGALLSGLIYALGGEVLKSSRQLVEQDVPLLREISQLRTEIIEQEAMLYEYFATLDRETFLRKYRPSDNLCLARLDTVAGVLADAGPIEDIRRDYGELRRLAGELDTVLRSAGADAPRARALLAQASRHARTLNAGLDTLAREVEAGVAQSADRTGAAVRHMSILAVLFSLGIFVIAVLIGYYVNAYLAEQAERRKLAMFPERNPNPVLRLSLAGEVVYANPAAGALLEAIGTDSARPAALLPSDLAERLERLRAFAGRYQVWEYPVGGRIIECGIHYLDDLGIFHAYITDVTARKQAEEQLVYQAYHDTLTELPNRRLFQERIGQVLWSEDRHGIRTAVLLMGLDRFKVVIDSVGHEVGDRLMKAVAERMQEIVRECRDICPGASLYRFEGDLFCLLIPGFAASDVPVLVAERILEGMDRPLYAAGREFFLSFSIGISVFPLDGLDAVTLLKNADTAMRRAKQAGGRTFQYYTQDMNILALELLKLENYLRHALERDEMHLYYQPQVDVASMRPVGAEALLRWRHPEHGWLAPGTFMQLAEETGLIVPIGEWVLKTACRQNRVWQDRGLPRVTIAVNISARQFHRQDLPRLIAAVLRETALPPECLELEITESVAMHDVEHTAETLRELKSMGVGLSIDDFGTGFSSLAYLKRFPIDKLKVDQSFVRNLITSENDAAITRAVITMGHALRLKVIAEGVDTAEQLARLRESGCDEVQGHLFGHPVPAEQFAQLLGERRRLAVN